MSSTNEAVVVLSLADRDDVDYLIADMSSCGADELIEVNLNDKVNCQAQLKKLFLAMARVLSERDVSIAFDGPEEYPRQFIVDAMDNYIADLGREVGTIRTAIKEDLVVQ